MNENKLERSALWAGVLMAVTCTWAYAQSMGSSAPPAEGAVCAEPGEAGACKLWSASSDDLFDHAASYEGKRVMLTGWVRLSATSDGVYLERDSHDRFGSERIRVETPPERESSAQARLRNVRIEGEFHAAQGADAKSWIGRLDKVSCFEFWPPAG